MHPVQLSNAPLNGTTLVVGNIYEFGQRHNAHLPLEQLAGVRLGKENFAVSAEASLFWPNKCDHCVALLPAYPHPEFVDTLSRLYRTRYECIVPRITTGWVCRDTLSDPAAKERLVAALQGMPVYVMPWTVTEDYYRLLDFLRDSGILLLPTDTPNYEDRWVVDYSDSKIGSRSILETFSSVHPALRVPTGYICQDKQLALLLARQVTSRLHEPLIVKSDRGDGGKSVILIDGAKTWDGTREDLLRDSMSSDLWDACGVVIEEAIGRGVDLSTPSFDGFVDATGAVSALAVDNMLTAERHCVGIEIGNGVFTEALYDQIREIGLGVGRALADLGFRGWFDVDFLLPTSGDALYASEINPRRGGATAPIQLAEQIHGYGWQRTVFVKSFEKLWLTAPLRDFAELAEIMAAVNEKYQSDRSAIVPLYSTSCTLRKPYVGYIVHGPNGELSRSLEQELLANLPIH